MLVLSRRIGQDIVIGEGEGAITVRIVEKRGQQVRVGVIAPKHVTVRRGELPPAGEPRPEGQPPGAGE